MMKMALDGILLHKIVNNLQFLEQSRINKIYQVSNTELLFQIKPKGPKVQLLISCHSQFNRIHLTDHKYPTPEEPNVFIMLLRKHLENGIIQSIQQGELDRYLTLTITNRNELGDIVQKYLMIELMGKYANAILCNEDFKIIDAMKRIPPFENTKRILQPGATYQYPESQQKKDPFTSTTYDPSLTFTEQFAGFSPLLSKEVQYRIEQGQTFSAIIKEIEESELFYISKKTDLEEYHCIPLTYLKIPAQAYPIMEALDVLYFHKEERDRIRQQTGDLFKFVRKEIKKSQQKLPKLYTSLEEAMNNEQWQVYGDLLYAYSYQVKKGMKAIELPSFENDSLIMIPLDEKLDGKQNAKKYFQKYRKGKNGQHYIQEQITITEKELHYFQGLEQQLLLADFNDAKEIREELVQYGYMSSIKQKIRKQKKVKEYHYLTVSVNDQVTIYVGKNNLQNDYLTFQLARKDYYWFHAKEFHGAHVVVNTSEPNEEVIRLAAMLAAYFSQGRQSSSIPVDYTQVKNIKKIPKSKLGFVSITNYKTIYIDIDETILSNYITL